MTDETIVETTSRAFEYWGAFGFVVVILVAIIVWLLKHINALQELHASQIAAAEEERRHWSDMAFKAIRDSGEQGFKALQNSREIIEYIKEKG